MKKVKYYFDNVISRGTGPLMLLLAAVSVVVVVLLSLISFVYLQLNPDLALEFADVESIEGMSSIAQAFWFTFHHVIAPGEALETVVESPLLIFTIMGIATLYGIIVFSLIISFISSAFNDKLESLRKGRNLVVEEGHTVILDYNDTVPIIVSELTESFENTKRSVIVILSERDPVEVLQELYSQVRKSKRTKVIVRVGSPMRKDDLALVSIDTAKSVILATIDDIDVIKTMLALKQTKIFEPTHPAHIVTTVKDYKNIEVIKNLGAPKVEVIYLAELKSKVFARSCLHPGLSNVYKNLFSFNGEEVYFEHQESFIGKTFNQLVEYVDGASVIGVLRDGQPKINPRSDLIYKEGDQCILIASDNGLAHYSEAVHQSYQKDFITQKYVNTGRRILTIGYNRSVAYVMRDMEKYVGEKSILTMLVPNEHNKEKLLAKYPNPKFDKFEVIVGSTFNIDVLQQLNLKDYDTIAVFANKDVTLDSADAETLITLLHLQSMKATMKQSPTLVVEIVENKNVESLEYIDVDDFLVSNVLVSKIMAQISENRYLNAVINELVSEEGEEFYLKRVNGYLPTGKPYPIYALVQAALERNQLLVGYKKEGEAIVLNPGKSDIITFGPKDRIIVAARQ